MPRARAKSSFASDRKQHFRAQREVRPDRRSERVTPTGEP
jgi:hypothetical protein